MSSQGSRMSGGRKSTKQYTRPKPEPPSSSRSSMGSSPAPPAEYPFPTDYVAQQSTRSRVSDDSSPSPSPSPLPSNAVSNRSVSPHGHGRRLDAYRSSTPLARINSSTSSVTRTVELNQESELHCLATMHNCDVRCLTAVNTITHGIVVWTGERDGSLFVIRVQTKEVIHQTHKLDHYPFSMVADPEGHVWVGFSDGRIRVFNAETFKELECSKEHHGSINCMVYHEGHVYTGCGGEYRIFKWSIKTLSIAQKFGPQTGNVRAMAIRHAKLYSSSDDAAIRVWDIDTGNCTEEWIGHGRPVRCMCVSDDDYLWSGSDDGEIRIWDCETSECLKILQHHKNAVYSLVSMGDRIWSAGADQSICVWHSARHELVGQRTDHEGYIQFMGVVKHTHIYDVWTSSADKTIRLWQAEVVDSGIPKERYNPPISPVVVGLRGGGIGSGGSNAGGRGGGSVEQDMLRNTVSSQNSQIRELQALLNEANKKNANLEFQTDQLQQIFDKRTQNHKDELQGIQEQLEDRDNRIDSLLEEKNRVEDSIAAMHGKLSFADLEKQEALRDLREQLAAAHSQKDTTHRNLMELERSSALRNQQLRDLENKLMSVEEEYHSVSTAITNELMVQGLHKSQLPKSAVIAFHQYSANMAPKSELDGHHKSASQAIESSAKLLNQVDNLQQTIRRLQEQNREKDDAISMLRGKTVELQGQMEIHKMNTSIVSQEEADAAQILGVLRSILGCQVGDEITELRHWAKARNMNQSLHQQNAYLEQLANSSPSTALQLQQDTPSYTEYMELQHGYKELEQLNEQVMHLSDQKSLQTREDQETILTLNRKVVQLQEQVLELERQVERQGVKGQQQQQQQGRGRSRSPTAGRGSARSGSASRTAQQQPQQRSTSPVIDLEEYSTIPSPQPPPSNAQLPPPDATFLLQSRSPFVRNVYTLYTQIVKIRNRANTFIAELSRRVSVQRTAIVTDVATIADNLKKLTDNSQWLLKTFLSEEERAVLGVGDILADKVSPKARYSGASKSSVKASAGSAASPHQSVNLRVCYAP